MEAEEKPKRKQNKRADFIRIWNEAASPQAAALELGISTAGATVRASVLRGEGYDVKRYRTRGPKLVERPA